MGRVGLVHLCGVGLAFPLYLLTELNLVLLKFPWMPLFYRRPPFSTWNTVCTCMHVRHRWQLKPLVNTVRFTCYRLPYVGHSWKVCLLTTNMFRSTKKLQNATRSRTRVNAKGLMTFKVKFTVIRATLAIAMNGLRNLKT